MNKFYGLSKGQLITFWIFFGIIWAMSLNSGIYILSNPSWVSYQEYGLGLLFLVWLIPFVLILYTLGWRNNRKKSM